MADGDIDRRSRRRRGGGGDVVTTTPTATDDQVRETTAEVRSKQSAIKFEHNVPVYGKIQSMFTRKEGEFEKTQDCLCESLSTARSTYSNLIVTGKVDGTCCYIGRDQDGTATLFARQDLKPTSKIPTGWFSFEDSRDPITGHWVGFRYLDPKNDKHHMKVLNDEGDSVKVLCFSDMYDLESKPTVELVKLESIVGQTAELVGPNVQGNPHGLRENVLIIHGSIRLNISLSELETKEQIIAFLNSPLGLVFEGIVIHDCDGQQLWKCHRGHLDLKILREYSKLVCD